uniref:Uncharacterized protein n=1 Tax=Timema bartmani TaxID=61472 RepID=A0A7R9EYV8_9NEOP|nr:unnamed protein product [Timema bartmani]
MCWEMCCGVGTYSPRSVFYCCQVDGMRTSSECQDDVERAHEAEEQPFVILQQYSTHRIISNPSENGKKRPGLYTADLKATMMRVDICGHVALPNRTISFARREPFVQGNYLSILSTELSLFRHCRQHIVELFLQHASQENKASVTWLQIQRFYVRSPVLPGSSHSREDN